jgi:hypothetical protein
MKMTDADRSELTNEEQMLRGEPGDLVTEESIPARPARSSVLVSLRIDRRTFDGLSTMAERRGATFSNVARDALRVYLLAHSPSGSYPDADRSGTQRRVSENVLRTWSDMDLQSELGQYESVCRNARMRESATRSYVDYARRFLAWRRGDYQPRGTSRNGRPVPPSSVDTQELRRQARLYATEIEAAGREQPTVDTYFRHAMFFIRWLEGDFQPGARLRGLR